MALSKNPNAYSDVRQIFDAALRAGGGRYTLPTPGKAKHWMQRAYYFRRLLFDLEQERFGAVPGYVAKTPYDNIVLRLEDCTVYIGFRQSLEGTLTDADGNTLVLDETEGQLSDEELAVAKRVARDLDLDLEE